MGRKVSDLGYGEFVAILHQAALKTGTEVVHVGMWEPTTQRCARCGARQEMPLRERHYACPQCGWSCRRDQNAAINIRAAGASAAGLGDGRRELLPAVAA